MIKITIPLKNGTEIEVQETDMEKAAEVINQMPEMIEQLNTALGVEVTEVIRPPESEESKPKPEGKSVEATDKVPNLPEDIKKKKKVREGIVALFKTPWGKKPRDLNDIKEALEQNTIYKPKSTIGSALYSLSAQSKLQRTRESPNENWKYVIGIEE